MSQENCPFCKIISGEFNSSKIYEDDHILAFMDINPVTKGHTLVIPKIHKELVSELEDQTLEHLIKVANKINKALRSSKIKPDGINFHISDGKAAGQEVPHVHLHLIPRFNGNPAGTKFVRNSNETAKRENLEQIANDIKIILNKQKKT